MGKIYSIGAGGMQDISVAADDKKNNLQVGRVLQLNGCGGNSCFIAENHGINPKYPNNGARYTIVNIKDFTIQTKDAVDLMFIGDKVDSRIQTYIMDEVLDRGDQLVISRMARKKQKEDKERQEKARIATDAKIDEGKRLFAKHIPDNAVALIVAELETDDCDVQTDYFNTTHSGRVILGWSTHKRDIFSEMRKHAHKIPETEHLVTVPPVDSGGNLRTGKNKSWWHPADEHREKYSMGKGYYLKAEGGYRTGWRISKSVKYNDAWGTEDYIAMADRCVFADTKTGQEPDAEQNTQHKSDTALSIARKAVIVQQEASQDAKTPHKVGEYRGHAIITLPISLKCSSGFTFGLIKAKAILAYIDEIREFVENNEN